MSKFEKVYANVLKVVLGVIVAAAILLIIGGICYVANKEGTVTETVSSYTIPGKIAKTENYVDRKVITEEKNNEELEREQKKLGSVSEQLQDRLEALEKANSNLESSIKNGDKEAITEAEANVEKMLADAKKDMDTIISIISGELYEVQTDLEEVNDSTKKLLEAVKQKEDKINLKNVMRAEISTDSLGKTTIRMILESEE